MYDEQNINSPLAFSAASTSTLLADGPTYPGSSEIDVPSFNTTDPKTSSDVELK